MAAMGAAESPAQLAAFWASGPPLLESGEERNALIPKTAEQRPADTRWRWLSTPYVWSAATTVLFVLALAFAGRHPALRLGAAKHDATELRSIGDLRSTGKYASETKPSRTALKRQLADTRLLTNKPRGDPRSYQFAVLDNGVKVLNVLDESAVKAAYAVSVQAGSFWDPVNLPGLAHFCEHMVFLGTKKYPSPTGFDNFMSQHMGEDNAYTANEVTVYYAETTADVAKSALDRLADFFRAPLFRKKFVEKEVHAINSEHEKNVEDPTLRVINVINSLADPRSPVSRFHTGNIETLLERPMKNHTSPVDALKVYFQNSYCPSRMSVVTYGPSSLAKQLKEASHDFASIERGKSCKDPVPTYGDPVPFPVSRCGKYVTINGTQPEAELWIQFPMPDLSKEYRSNPLDYIEHVFAYSGVGSLTRVLQDSLGLVTAYNTMWDMSSAGTIFYNVFKLTAKGVENLEFVLDMFFSYVAELRHRGVDEKLYQTLADKEKLVWDWQELAGPKETVSNFAEQLTRLPAEFLLTGDSRIDAPNATLVASLIEMITPERMIAAFVSARGEEPSILSDGTRVEVLPYYGVAYAVQELSDALPGASHRWSRWLESGANSTLELDDELGERLALTNLTAMSTLYPVPPKPIEGIPKNLSLEHMKAQPGNPDEEGVSSALFGAMPVQLATGEEGDAESIPPAEQAVPTNRSGLEALHEELWYRSGWVTSSPLVDIKLTLRPLRTKDEPEKSALDEGRLLIFSRLLREELVPKMVDLVDTGVTYDITLASDELGFYFGGFAPLLPTLVRLVLEEFNHFNANLTCTSSERFDRILQDVRKSLMTYDDMPVSYALGDRSVLLERGEHSKGEVLAALVNITREDVARSVGEILLSRPLRLTSLVMGNIPEGDANDVVRNITDGIRVPDWLAAPSKEKWVAEEAGEVELVTPLVNVSQPVEVRSPNPRHGDPNDVTVVTVLGDVSRIEERVVIDLLGQILASLAYEELRTKRQLGYVVNAGASRMSNVLYVSALVQGTKMNADDMEGAIELVLTKLMPEKLQNLTAEDFENYRKALVDVILEPPIKPTDELNQFWGPVQLLGQCFQVKDELLEYLNSSAVTKELLVSTWADLMVPKEGLRKKVTVKYFAGAVPDRPTPEEVEASWLDFGVSDEAMPLLLREHNRTQLFSKADSAVRAQLQEQGGLYPQELYCERRKPTATV